MNKGDLINEVSKAVSGRKEARAAVDCVFSCITETSKNKGRIVLAGFGTFKVEKRKARKGKTPRTGEEIKIKAKWVRKFISGKDLKNALR
ncbi:MAG: HU family DNA-binding protein [Deltaproteobacteria bacterium]|nr:HU family DNA-binding protein [Deltaproteobacteria bacterium]